MKQLIYATTNVAKLNMMSNFLEPLGIKITGLDRALPIATESGKLPLENARQKALTYYAILKKPLFSCDSGLFFEGLPLDLQPGVNVKNIDGKSLTDEMMIEYYSNLANRYGQNGQLIARYKNAICLIIDDKTRIEYDGDDLGGERFIISSKPHSIKREGFPLDSLSIHIDTQKYYFDLPAFHSSFSMEKGFQKFFQNNMTVLNNSEN